MIKFTVNQNKAFWDEYAKNSKQNPFGAHTDKHVVNLENDFIISQLKIKSFKSMLDVGCGNCQRTLFFSKFVKGNTLGIDYSEKMIYYANLILSRQKNQSDKRFHLLYRTLKIFQMKILVLASLVAH